MNCIINCTTNKKTFKKLNYGLLRICKGFFFRTNFPALPQTHISILISTTVLHLDIFALCSQHCRHVHSHWSGPGSSTCWSLTLTILRRKKRKCHGHIHVQCLNCRGWSPPQLFSRPPTHCQIMYLGVSSKTNRRQFDIMKWKVW